MFGRSVFGLLDACWIDRASAAMVALPVIVGVLSSGGVSMAREQLKRGSRVRFEVRLEPELASRMYDLAAAERTTLSAVAHRILTAGLAVAEDRGEYFKH